MVAIDNQNLEYITIPSKYYFFAYFSLKDRIFMIKRLVRNTEFLFELNRCYLLAKQFAGNQI